MLPLSASSSLRLLSGAFLLDPHSPIPGSKKEVSVCFSSKVTDHLTQSSNSWEADGAVLNSLCTISAHPAAPDLAFWEGDAEAVPASGSRLCRRGCKRRVLSWRKSA